jgi:hypothetical protein
MRATTASGIVIVALANAALAGPTSVAPKSAVALPSAWTETVGYRCRGDYRWIPDGRIAGPTAGYPYYGWYGYPYLPYRCVRVHRHVYVYSRHRTRRTCN